MTNPCSNTFTDKASEFYKEACKKNRDQSEFYYCATSNNTTKRILNYESNDAFCEHERKGDVKKKYDEYKLQAFW